MAVDAKKLPKQTALIFGFVSLITYFILGVIAILRSGSSTAGIGFIILPFQGAFVFLIFGFTGFWIGLIAQGIVDRQYRKKLRFILAFIIAIPASIYFATLSMEIYSTYRDIDRISVMSTPELEQAFLNRPTHSRYGYDIFIIAAIAQNPQTSGALLDTIAHLEDPRMNDSLGALINLTRENSKGLAVIRLVVHNPNVKTKTLVYLTNSKNNNLLGDIASNRKLSPDILRQLYSKSQNNPEGYLIEWGLAYNPNTPPDILRALAKKIKYNTGFDVINSALTNNPSTPDDVRKLLF